MLLPVADELVVDAAVVADEDVAVVVDAAVVVGDGLCFY